MDKDKELLIIVVFLTVGLLFAAFSAYSHSITEEEAGGRIYRLPPGEVEKNFAACLSCHYADNIIKPPDSHDDRASNCMTCHTPVN